LIHLISTTNAYLVWDGVFSELTYSAPPLPNPRLFYDRAIVIGTLSKAYGLPGLRVGWCLASHDVLDRCIHFRDYTTICLSPLVEFIAHRVIQQADYFLNLRFQQAHTNLNLLTEWMVHHQEFIQWIPPQGSVTVFPKLLTVPNTETFCRMLMKEYGVLLAPGTCFSHPTHVRLGFGTSTINFETGLARLSQFLREF
jgi:aspartate/methionine/tyrosine aminotransferase